MTERFTGHGAEWRDSNLSPAEAKIATSWVELKVDKRSMLTNKDRVEDVRDAMWQLEKEGEIVVHRVQDEHQPMMVKTLYGWDKKIPTTRLWHHKSCGQCGNIPGYPASLLWLMNKMDIEYLDETDQTSCTAWNYHGSGIGNLESLAAVFLRNFHQAYVAAKAQGLPDAYYYPLVHCGTSFGNYKEVRGYLIHSAKLRESVQEDPRQARAPGRRQAADPRGGRALLGMAARDARSHRADARRSTAATSAPRSIPLATCTRWCPRTRSTTTPILGGNRLANSTGLMQALGAQVIDYSTWYDCCGFGFRHIISEREFTRSFAIDRKIRVAVEEAHADVMIGHDTGCITTLDKNQWIGKAAGKAVELRGARRLPVRRAGVRRASVQDRAVALARLAHRDADGEARHRLAGEEGRVRRLSRGDQGRQAGKPLRPAPHDHFRAGLHSSARQSNERTDSRRRRRAPPASPRRMRSPRVGQRVVLVDKESKLGGAPILSGYAKLVPSGEWARDAIGGMVRRVESNALVSHSREQQSRGIRRRARQLHGDACPTAPRSRQSRRSCAPASRTSTR